MEQWQAILVFFGVSVAIPMSMVIGARILAVRAKKQTKANARLKTMTYECGEEPEGGAWIQFHPRYYVIALVFVLFDVEAVFLFPWALNIEELGGLAIVDMGIFVAVLMLGWLYALKKGALKWQ